MNRVRKQLEVPEVIEKAVKKVTVAVLDTGIGRHPDLAGKILGFQDFVHERKLMYDDSGHGTHVSGIICGMGKLSGGDYRGVAPESMLVVGKVLDQNGDGTTENMLAGLRWIGEVKKRFHIRVLNVSVGIGMLDSSKKEELLKCQLDELWDQGIFVVCAAGNKGPENNSISALGSGGKIVTVGCHDGSFFRENARRCESYSGRGEAFSAMRKPDLVAPGTDVISCNVACHKRNGKWNHSYVAKSGTSMATPIVAGAAALALEKYPNMTNEELRHKMTLTATDLGEPWNKQGWGMINIKRLLE
ncbi:MAG: hypothetical protein E7286_10500 [Lachnospiraceae bacterium]|nr:hypothetical protein [Lachnospiraceae bacterium]